MSENILRSLKDIIRLSGLDPIKFVSDWATTHHAISTWIASGHLERISLEIFDPRNDQLLTRWDIEVSYEWNGGDGTFFVDPEQLRQAIRKAGVWEGSARYDVKVKTRPDRPDIPGWVRCQYRSDEGFVRQSLGTTINHGGLAAGTSYLRKR